MLARGLAVCDTTGKAYRVAGSMTDITDRKRAELALRESEERYRTLTEKAYDLIGELGLEGRLLYVSPNHENVLGYAPSELVGRNGFDFVHPDDLAGVRAAFGEDQAQETFRFRHKSGEWRWFEGTGKAFRTQTGEYRAVIVSREITARRQAEAQLRYHANLLHNVNDAIIATDARLVVTAWNRAAERMYGWTADETLGRPAREVSAWEHLGVVSPEPLRTLQGTGQWGGELMQRRRDGSPIYVEAKTMAVRDETGQIVGVVSVNRDITGRKQAEEALRYRVGFERLLARMSTHFIKLSPAQLTS